MSLCVSERILCRPCIAVSGAIYTLPNIKQRLLKKLDNPAFDDIRENDDFLKLLENVNRA